MAIAFKSEDYSYQPIRDDGTILPDKYKSMVSTFLCIHCNLVMLLISKSETILADQYEFFQHILSSLTYFLEITLDFSKQKHLTSEFL